MAGQIAAAGYAIVALGDKRIAQLRGLRCAVFQQQQSALQQVAARLLDDVHQIRVALLGGDQRLPRFESQSGQRRIVIILVLANEEGADIDQALRSAMAGEAVRAPIFESLLSQYSLGGGSTFTWLP